MKVSITSLELKTPFKFFPLSLYSLRILRQLKHEQVKSIKTTGLWTKHYTLSAWDNEEDMHKFVRSGAHQDAMKKSKTIAKEIRVLTIDRDDIPDWKTARAMLIEQGKVMRF